jgi:uncharacterized membrane protein
MTTLPTEAQVLKITRAIWLGILISATSIAYVSIAIISKGFESKRIIPDLNSPVELMLTLFSILTFGLSFKVPTTILNQAKPKVTTVHTFVAYISSFALAEASTLLGFTLSVIAHSGLMVIPGFILTIVALFSNRPVSART